MIAIDRENISTQMKKGVLEYLIILIINKWEIYASDIMSQLQESNLLIVEGTLYPLLSRLKKDWLLNYQRFESPSWPPRKYYTLTNHGKEVLCFMDSIRKQLSNAVDTISK